MRKMILLALAASICTASPVFAKKDDKPTPAPTPAPSTVVLNGVCLGDIGAPVVLGCIGYFDKNLLNKESEGQQKLALAELGFVAPTFDFNSFDKIPSLQGSKTVDFGTTLYGTTFVGFHFGGGSDAGNVTAFYKIDAGTQGVQTITLLETASSGAVLYGTSAGPNGPDAVPEPATWAMMIGGFGLLGAAARRRARPTVTYA